MSHASTSGASPLSARWPWLFDLIAIDLRAFAALRIGVALIILVDLAMRACDLTAFYTDAGVLPRADRMALEIRYCEPWWMSLHMLSGSFAWAAFLAILAAAAAIALLLGWRTRIALVVSWLLLYSIQARFPMLLQGGDVLLRCMLVWMFFLPIDARWSLRHSQEIPAERIASIGGLGLLLQLCAMYFFSALLKTSPMWVRDFSAVYYALNIDHFSRPLGYFLAEYPQFLQIITVLTMLLELAGPLLMFEPFGRRLWRWLIPLSFIGFHLGLYVSLELGTFPWICVLAWSVFLPSAFWDRVERLIQSLFQKAEAPSDSKATPVSWYGGAAFSAIAAYLVLYVLVMNIRKLEHPYAQVGAFPIAQVGRVTGLEQYWNMFAPGPYAFGSWIRVEGELSSGKIVNLYASNEPLPDAKPRNVSATYPTQYWRRCMVMAYEVQEKPHLAGILRYLSQRWNAAHGPDEQVVRARFVHMTTPTPPPGAPKNIQAERKVLCDLPIASPQYVAK